MEIIKIKYHADIEPLSMSDKGDWIDLRAAEDVKLKEGEFYLISLGVSMQFEKGYEALVIPRSSTYKNFGIIQANSCGLIDNSYCGDDDIWKFPAIALRDTEIHKGDRICQFRLLKSMDKVIFNVVDSLNNENRGGFGTTGIN